MSTRGDDQDRATLAWVAVVVAILNALATVMVALVTASPSEVAALITQSGGWINVVAGPTFPLLDALILRYRDPTKPQRQDRLAWLLLGLGVICTLTSVVFTYADMGLRHDAPLALAAAWVESWLWTSVAPGITLLLLWFPTGDAPGPRWRWVGYGAVAADAVLWLGTAFVPGRFTDFRAPVDNPLGSSATQPVLGPVGGIGRLLLAVVFLAAILSLIVRYRRGDASVRAQLRWLVLAVTLFVVTLSLPDTGSIAGVALTLNVLATALLPLTLGVALTRSGFALPRFLVFGLLSTLLLLAYVAVVGVAEAAFGSRADRAATLVAAGLIAVVVAPLRVRLQGAVDRLVYGDRGDPYAVLADLGRRVTGSPDELLHEIVRSVSDALRAPYVAVVLAGDEAPTAATGTTTGSDVVVPLALQGCTVGTMIVANRDLREPYGERDLALLQDLARLTAVAAHAAALSRDLQRSRESLVLTREEERRRIRRDLHDGLGPALAGVAFGLDAARYTMGKDPEAARQSLVELKKDVQTSINDIRRLVYKPAAARAGPARAHARVTGVRRSAVRKRRP